MSEPYAPMSPGCPSCNELMTYKCFTPCGLLYEKPLNEYTFECLNCGQLLVETFGDDRGWSLAA